MTEPPAFVDLYWLPLGAGGHSVRMNGKAYEACVSRLERRPRRDLYHSALVVGLPEGRFVVEQAPAGTEPRTDRGVVSTGAVGSPRLGRWRIFRYELRCWHEGVIPDVGEAVESPRRVTEDEIVARRVVEHARSVPAAVWGRDELETGEMWNSNSAIAWLLTRAGVEIDAVPLPAGGRAPGWDAGVVVARRELDCTPDDRADT